MEYKTSTYKDNGTGRAAMARDIDRLSMEGWTLKSQQTASQNYSFGKTCCLGCVFLPLALLGKKNGIITVIMERKKGEIIQSKAVSIKKRSVQNKVNRSTNTSKRVQKS